MATPAIDGEVREARQAAHALLPTRDFDKPGPTAMSLDEAAHKIDVEYSDALEALGKL